MNPGCTATLMASVEVLGLAASCWAVESTGWAHTTSKTNHHSKKRIWSKNVNDAACTGTLLYVRHGYGAEYVLQMKAVTADGSIVTVNPDNTVFQNGR